MSPNWRILHHVGFKKLNSTNQSQLLSDIIVSLSLMLVLFCQILGNIRTLLCQVITSLRMKKSNIKEICTLFLRKLICWTVTRIVVCLIRKAKQICHQAAASMFWLLTKKTVKRAENTVTIIGRILLFLITSIIHPLMSLIVDFGTVLVVHSVHLTNTNLHVGEASVQILEVNQK